MIFQKLYRVFTNKSQRLKRLFSTVMDFIPAVEYLSPDTMEIRNSFLTENRFKEKRENLAEELRVWIDLLCRNKNTIDEYVDECLRMEANYQRILSEGITIALDEIRTLELSYRTLESFFRNANTDYIENLTLINVNKYDIDSESKLANKVGQYIENDYDRFNLKDSYSLLVMPGYVLYDMPTLIQWAKLAFKYKILLITDYKDERNFEELCDNTRYCCNDEQAFQNVVMTANWIVGRESEELSECEKEEPAFFIPPSAALAGRLYAESANGWSFLHNKDLLFLNETKGVRNDLLKSEIAALMDNQVVPMIMPQGCVVSFNNATLYRGDKEMMKVYPFVYLMNWMKKVLIKIITDEAFKSTDDRYIPVNIKNGINGFFWQFNKEEKLFKKVVVCEPTFDPMSKMCSIEIELSVETVPLIEYVEAPFCKIRVTYDPRNILYCDAEVV